jgi:FkbM family methyltransferase
MKTPQPIRVDVNGDEIFYYLPHEDDHIQKSIRKSGQLYEHGLLYDALSRSLPPGVIIDVGANIGIHSVFFAKMLSRKVIAIEPFQIVFDILKETITLNNLQGAVSLVAKAAGKKCGLGKIVLPPNDNLGQARIVTSEHGEIEIIRLDDLELVEPVAMIKVDVEGMEIDVIEGALEILEKYKPVLYVEAITASSYEELRHLLRPLGYEMTRRFNHTPTYVFLCCETTEDNIRALLERTESIAGLHDEMREQRELHSQIIRSQELIGERLGEQRELYSQIVRSQELIGKRVGEEVKLILDELPNPAQIVEAIDQLEKRLIGTIDRWRDELEPALSYRLRLSGDLKNRKLTGASDPSLRNIKIPVRIGSTELHVKVAVQDAGHASTYDIRDREPTSLNGMRQKGKAVSSKKAPIRRTQTLDSLGSQIHKVSVIMTTHNSATFLAPALESIIAQTYSNIEVIIVDDASSDNTFEVLQQFALEDKRIRPFKMFQNRGTYWSKNFGITKATGAYVTFQDSDDVSDPKRIEVQLAEMLKQPDTVMCTCNYVRIGPTGQMVPNRGVHERKAIMAALFDKDQILRRVGYFDSIRTSADDEFTRRVELVYGKSRVSHVNAPLYKAKLRDGSLTNSATTRCDIGKQVTSSSDLSFLSASRREYVTQFLDWHHRLKIGTDDPKMPFPMHRRKFPAPSLLWTTPQTSNDYITASMASIPERSKLLKSSIESILDQVDILNVYLNGYRTKPAFLSDKKIRVVHSKEYGDLRDNGKFFFLDSLLWGYH